MIKSFKDKMAARLFQGEGGNRYPKNLQRPILRKLTILHAAISLQDLRVPPGNHLERLKDDLRGLWSIRVNDQWRVCFRSHGSDAYDVEIKDYH